MKNLILNNNFKKNKNSIYFLLAEYYFIFIAILIRMMLFIRTE